MTKIRTLSQLQTALDAEMSWRLKEILALKLASKAKSLQNEVIVRAGIALVYAHWEGFIKITAEQYLNFIDNQGLIYRDLKTCFGIFGLKGKLNTLVESNKAKPNIEALDFIMSHLDKPTKISLAAAINTEANLSSKVFVNIAMSLDLDPTNYDTKFNLIDESLLGRRNRIAHGEFLDLDVEDFRSLADEVLGLMRNFKTDIENAASLKSYRRAV